MRVKMKKHKIIISSTIVALIISNIYRYAYGTTQFKDDNEIQSYSRYYVEMLVNEGGISGYTDNTFKPQGTISRAEFLVMCVKSFGNVNEILKEVTTEEYINILNQYQYNAVWNGAGNDILVAANHIGLCKRYIGNEWNIPITRAEASEILYNSLFKLGNEKDYTKIETNIISDWNIFSDSEYVDYIEALFSLGVVQGDSNGNFNPNNNLTREDSAILICKALKSELREVRVVNDNTFNTAVTGDRGIRSIKNLIKTAFEPVGSVMYIYGGGWNEEDNGAGKESMTLGLSQNWLDFTKQQNNSYNHQNYDYKTDVNVIHNGLDCSGYVGWVIYNVLNDGVGYVTNSYKIDDMLAEKGYGSITLKENVKERKPGDIMCSGCNDCKHVYISLGMCSDGSELLLHSSPPGVQLSGTYTPSGNKNSEAIKLAEKYMSKYFTDWYNKYPDNSRNASYLTHYDRFQWSILSDEEGYRNLTPEEILKDIFGE